MSQQMNQVNTTGMPSLQQQIIVNNIAQSKVISQQQLTTSNDQNMVSNVPNLVNVQSYIVNSSSAMPQHTSNSNISGMNVQSLSGLTVPTSIVTSVNSLSAQTSVNGTQSFTTTVTSKSNTVSTPSPVPNSSMNSSQLNSTNDGPQQILNKPRLMELVRDVDPTLQLDEDVEEMLLQIADDFVDTVMNGACKIAKHRHVPNVEVRDVQLYLEKAYNMWIPGFGTDELRPYKRSAVTDAHKQRMALIRKAKKF